MNEYASDASAAPEVRHANFVVPDSRDGEPELVREPISNERTCLFKADGAARADTGPIAAERRDRVACDEFWYAATMRVQPTHIAARLDRRSHG
ncbi:hypothetical protein [Kribbella italica]|uniref:Uncharacterized protein n=1 Tax=Kribbella italica TaxID=1540520 RepID=A0A7W9JEE2_9ACTN|nr:hypothetical protein [Kribbella italica]MBB5840626.1 hypothetical protein [Kribbella italica]